MKNSTYILSILFFFQSIIVSAQLTGTEIPGTACAGQAASTRVGLAGWNNNSPGGTSTQDGYISQFSPSLAWSYNPNGYNTTFLSGNGSNIMDGPGLTTYLNSSARVVTQSTATSTTLADALNNGDYLQMSITTNSSTNLNTYSFRDVVLTLWQRGGSASFAILISTSADFSTYYKLGEFSFTGAAYNTALGSYSMPFYNLTSSPNLAPNTTYYIRAYIYKITSNSDVTFDDFNLIAGQCFCYKPATADAGNTYPTKHGITAMGRAGADNSNWPMERQGAWTVLEAKTKGFVVNRIKTTAEVNAIASPVEGMMVYDVEADCLKIYTSKDNGVTFGWHCLNTQTCPDY